MLLQLFEMTFQKFLRNQNLWTWYFEAPKKNTIVWKILHLTFQKYSYFSEAIEETWYTSR